jgi:alkaline phosphatase D
MAANGKPKFRLIAFLAILCLLRSNTQLFSQSESGSARLMQGPMVGVVHENEIEVWVRVSGAFPVSIEFSTHADLEGAIETEPVLAAKSNDYTLVIKLKNLLPETTYFYRVKVDGKYDRYVRESPPLQTKTAPRLGVEKSFRIAFGSCARFPMDRIQRIWTAVHSIIRICFFGLAIILW